MNEPLQCGDCGGYYDPSTTPYNGVCPRCYEENKAEYDIIVKAKTSNMKRVIQMTLKHDPSDHFDAESRIAGMSATPGFISALAVASKAGSVEADQIIGYFEDGHPTLSLVPGQRYAWIMMPEVQS